MHSTESRALRQLWGLESATTRGPKARWSAEQLASAAVALADEVGLEAVSLARVAERLGMTTTAVYRYVDSKDTLIDLMVDAAIGDPPPIATPEPTSTPEPTTTPEPTATPKPTTTPDWRASCRNWVAELADQHAAHPWLADVRPSGMPRQPRAYAWIDALVRVIPPESQVDALRLALLLDSLVRSYAALERSVDGTEPEPWLGAAVAARFPALAAAPQQDVSDPRAELDYAVDAVLHGMAG